ncbi:serine kinase [Variovorax sp. MHTC-1]|uniref:serine kinase n=1 Tax=Variovorax sp. MHTC-1 TaxID=2495593 RepID=UPI000F897AD0|nr:serine kinase [Variovorax sp. MHTC-1]RST56447.1 serine kinase [Variovorax sp. MHTC-1]
MSVDWKMLIAVRERQKTAAMGVVAREREAAARSLAELQQAEERHRQELESKASHWQDLQGAFASGQCNVAQLRVAGAWSGALDAQIAKAGSAAVQAGAAHAQHEELLARSRQALRAASGEVEKAQCMQQRERAEHARMQELRQEDASEEATTQAWLARRAI